MSATDNPDLRAEEQQAIAHVACPLESCLADVGVGCVDRPPYEGGPLAHRPRVGAYRNWLAAQTG